MCKSTSLSVLGHLPGRTAQVEVELEVEVKVGLSSTSCESTPWPAFGPTMSKFLWWVSRHKTITTIWSPIIGGRCLMFLGVGAIPM